MSSEFETKFLGIKPMNIPADQLEILNHAMTSKRYTPVSRDRLQAKISGRCCVCGGIPTQIASYDCSGATRIERYCSPCVEKQFSRTQKVPTNGGN
jgi:hypothetical protein